MSSNKAIGVAVIKQVLDLARAAPPAGEFSKGWFYGQLRLIEDHPEIFGLNLDALENAKQELGGIFTQPVAPTKRPPKVLIDQEDIPF